MPAFYSVITTMQDPVAPGKHVFVAAMANVEHTRLSGSHVGDVIVPVPLPRSVAVLSTMAISQFPPLHRSWKYAVTVQQVPRVAYHPGAVKPGFVVSL